MRPATTTCGAPLSAAKPSRSCVGRDAELSAARDRREAFDDVSESAAEKPIAKDEAHTDGDLHAPCDDVPFGATLRECRPHRELIRSNHDLHFAPFFFGAAAGSALPFGGGASGSFFGGPLGPFSSAPAFFFGPAPGFLSPATMLAHRAPLCTEESACTGERTRPVVGATKRAARKSNAARVIIIEIPRHTGVDVGRGRDVMITGTKTANVITGFGAVPA